MKKKLRILDIASLVVIIIIIVSIAFKGNKFDAESKRYVDAAIISIVSDWDKQELTKRASPEFMKATGNNDLDRLFNLFRKLGKFKEYKGSEGQATISITTEHGKIISASNTLKNIFHHLFMGDILWHSKS